MFLDLSPEKTDQTHNEGGRDKDDQRQFIIYQKQIAEKYQSGQGVFNEADQDTGNEPLEHGQISGRSGNEFSGLPAVIESKGKSHILFIKVYPQRLHCPGLSAGT